MAFTTILPVASRQGNLSSPATALPPGLTRYDLRLDSANFGTAPFVGVRIAFSVAFSFDGGATFPYANSTTFEGGKPPIRAWRMAGTIPPPPNYPTHFRAECATTGGAANFGVSAEVT